MVIKKLEINKSYDFKKPLNVFLSKRNQENIYKKEIEINGEIIYLVIFEQYFFRINSDLTVSILIHQSIEKTIIEIISSGGGVGIFSENWGSEEKSIVELYNTLTKDGFREVK